MGRPRSFSCSPTPRLDADLRPTAPHGLRSVIDDLKNFRQLQSRTPATPEYGHTPASNHHRPAGQGITNAVGWRHRRKVLAPSSTSPGHTIVDHTYAFLGDGCLMEGISHEACSLAGTLGLGKLIAFYDDNGISIDGHVEAGSRRHPKPLRSLRLARRAAGGRPRPVAIEAALLAARLSPTSPA